MENHKIVTHNKKNVVWILLEMPQIPHKLFGPFAQIGQLSGIFLKKKTLHTSMVIHYSHQQKPLYLEYGIIAKQIDSTKPIFSPKYFLSHQRIGSIKRKS